MKRREKKATRLLLEELEPRILHSADVAVLVPPAAFMQLAEVRLVDSVPDAMQGTAAHTPAAEASASAPREIAIVDSSVEDYQRLVDDLMANSRGTMEVFVLDAAADGVGQISRILSTQHDIQTIHLISHGSEGAVQLGAGVLNQETLVRSAAALAGWADALTADADILIYGCDVAAGPGGRAFVDALSGLTGADVAASDDLTGSAARGGDWTLEYRTGHIESSIPIDAETQRAWSGTLAIGADAASSAATVGAQSALTFAHTVGSGTDRLLVVEVSTDSTQPVTSVTYGGTALTQLSAITDGANKVRAEVWYLVAPSSGTANVVVSLGSGKEFVAGATSFSGVDQSTTFGTPVTAEGAGGAPSVTVASAVGEIVFDVVALRDRTSGAAGGAQTALWTNTNGTGSADAWGGSSTSAGAGSVTMGWSSAGGGAGEWAAIAVAMKAAPAVAPVLTGANDLTAINEDASANPGTLVSALLSGHVTDGNSGASSGIAVTAVDNTNGAWQYSTTGGAAWIAFGTPGSSTARLLAADAGSYVRFVPAVNWNGAVAAGLTFRAWDQTSGTAGGTADTTANGGATAFSSSTAASGITVNAVNDAPSLSGGTLAAIDEDTINPPGAAVSSIFSGKFSDVDAGSSLSGIAVVGNGASAVTQGAWQYSSNGGTNWFAIGSVGDDATARALSASTLLRFVPVAGFNGTPVALTVRGLDDTYAGAFSATVASETPVAVDTTSRGGSTAIAAATATVSTGVTSVNDAPAGADRTVTTAE
ncbi:MAG: hypothetical protein JWO70_583, partial [Betaproteobacteria bacterium]|nr:hypothetical protein [Betaproteobacteria bacterium]